MENSATHRAMAHVGRYREPEWDVLRAWLLGWAMVRGNCVTNTQCVYVIIHVGSVPHTRPGFALALPGNIVRMDYTRLGESGLYVSRLALGTISFGSGGGFEQIAGLRGDDAKSQLHAALDRGVNFIDTADLYSAGDAERVLGETLGTTRDEFVLTSKARMPVGDGPNDSGASRYHLTRAVENSLARLRTDHLDLLYIHQWDGQTPIRETIRTCN